MTAAAIANPTAREFLGNADLILAQVIDAHPTSARARGSTSISTEREMVEVAERWRPYRRSLAVSYLFASEFEERT